MKRTNREPEIEEIFPAGSSQKELVKQA